MSTHASQTDILLESGTNELEIIEFLIGNSTYGINVARVREIIRFPEATVPVPNEHPSLVREIIRFPEATVPVPNEHPSLEGIVDLRGQVVPIINLQRHLGVINDIDRSTSYVIVSEFNNSMIGFCVS